MAPTPDGIAFLNALMHYVNFRLTEKEPLKSADDLDRSVLEFEDRFKEILLKKTHEGSAAFNHLMDGMKAMKTGGGGTGRKPT